MIPVKSKYVDASSGFFTNPNDPVEDQPRDELLDKLKQLKYTPWEEARKHLEAAEKEGRLVYVRD